MSQPPIVTREEYGDADGDARYRLPPARPPAPSEPSRYEGVADPRDLFEKMSREASRLRLRDGLRKQAIQDLVPPDGTTIADFVAGKRTQRLDAIGAAKFPTLAAARAEVTRAELEQKEVERGEATVRKRLAAAKGEVDKLDARARQVEADAAKVAAKLEAERARESAIVAGGDLDAVEGWSRDVGDLERRAGAAGKIAAAVRAQADAAAQKVAKHAHDLEAVGMLMNRSRAVTLAAKVRAKAAEVAAAIAKELAPLVAELEPLLVELCTAGEDPSAAMFAREQAALVLRAALEG